MTRDITTVEELNFVPLGSHSDGLDISAAQVLTKPTAVRKLMIQALTQNIRFTLDGTTPTTSSGFQLKAGDPPIILPISATTVITLIEEAATADLQYQFGV